jgi:Mrp family chromosome partitioning ATPase
VSITVLVAVTHRLETGLVTALEEAPGVTVVRRCADLPDLLAAASAGAAAVAVVSPDLRSLDRDAVRHLAGHGVRVAGLVDPDDEAGERRLRQLGIALVLGPQAGPDDLAERLRALVAGTTSHPAPDVQDPLDLAVGEPSSPWAPGARGAAPNHPPAQAGAGRSTLHEPGRGLVTAVWGPTGAPGRTTIAVTLAATLAEAGVPTLLIDLDTYGASVAQALALLDEAPGLAAAARASESGALDVPGLARLAPEAAPRLRVLTGISTPGRWTEVRAPVVEDLLALARSLAAHVVVDCGFGIEDDEELSYDTAAPRRNATTLAALEQADHLLVVGSGDPVGLQRLVRAVQDVASRPAPAPLVVVNKVRAAVAGPHPERQIREVLTRFAGLEAPRFVPWAPQECDAATLAGRSLVEHAPLGVVAGAVGALAALVDARVPSAEQTRRSTRGGGRGRRAVRPG